MASFVKRVFWHLKGEIMEHAKHHSPRLYISILYHDRLRRWINWWQPRDLNEKINWLKFNSDTTTWTKLADKFLVREYVKQCGLEEILIPIHGVWKDANDIDFSSLPNRFVIKPNHGCGDVVVVKDKDKADLEAIRTQMQTAISQKFGYELAEWHYLEIPPVVMCENLLQQPDGEDLTDYKVWCFDGKPYYILTCSNRDIATHKTILNLFDTDWNRKDQFMAPKYRNSLQVRKPEKLQEMLAYAEKLANSFPQVRVDFYEVEGKLYFGEMTFTSRSGMMDYFTLDALLEMGKHITLPKKANT